MVEVPWPTVLQASRAKAQLRPGAVRRLEPAAPALLVAKAQLLPGAVDAAARRGAAPSRRWWRSTGGAPPFTPSRAKARLRPGAVRRLEPDGSHAFARESATTPGRS